MSNDSIAVEGDRRLSKSVSYQLGRRKLSSSEEGMKEKEPSCWGNLPGIGVMLKTKIAKLLLLGQCLRYAIIAESEPFVVPVVCF